MIHPIPSGTRDVLPDEMRELRAITERAARRLRARRLRRGLDARARVRGDARARRRGARRPRLPPVRRAGRRARAALGHDGADRAPRRHALRRRAEPPLRFCYFAHAYRGVRPQRGQPREFLQAGIELVGAPGAGGDGRGAQRAVRGARRRRAARLPHRARRRVAVPGAARRARRAEPRRERRCCTSSSRATSSASSARSRALGLDADAAELLVRVPQLRGGAGGARRARRRRPTRRWAARVLDAAAAARRRAGDLRPRARRAASGYYTGAIFEVYDPALGVPLGGGGRYDELLGRFGRPLPAVGFALERRAAAHRAGRRGAASGDEPHGLTIAVPRGALFERDARPARRARHRHRRGARQRPQAAVRATSASSRCAPPTCRPTSRPAPPTSASPARTS